MRGLEFRVQGVLGGGRTLLSALYSHSLPLSSSLAALPSAARGVRKERKIGVGGLAHTRNKVFVGFIFAVRWLGV